MVRVKPDWIPVGGPLIGDLICNSEDGKISYRDTEKIGGFLRDIKIF